jgi:gamma-D-glutamyl-L-lysine dipeptidyl-peptidase
VTSAIIARSAVVPVLGGPTLRADQVSQMVLGETAAVLDVSAEWRRVRTTLDHYEGWVHTGYCVEVEGEGAAAWRRDAEGWSEGAFVQVDGGRARLPLRARVALAGDLVRLPDGRTGRVVEGAVRPAADAVTAARTSAPERWAWERFAGTQYQWGGVTPLGADCSGMVQTTFLARGVALPRDSPQQSACGAAIPLDAIRPGDLLFFRDASGPRITHVALAGEGDTLVHSTVSCGGMVQEPWARGSRAAPLRERLVAVRRLEAR